MKMHIGEEIEKKFQESGLKITVFADKINTGERNVYSIFKREDISADMLRKISDVLNYNFFALYEGMLDQSIVNEPSDEYQSKANKITVNLTLSGTINAYSHFSDFLMKLKSQAKEAGFDIN